MQHSPGKQIVALFSILLLLFSMALPVGAAVHPLSRVDHNSATGVSDIDVTISLDWDPARYTTPDIMTKTGMENAVKEYAASLFAMTNGLHRLRNIYIYKSKKFWSSADIRYVSTRGDRSEANVAGWKVPNEGITMYIYEDIKKPESIDEMPGSTMGHESGHYIYGIFDEYREVNGKSIAELKDPGAPSKEDYQTHPSIMNDNEKYPNWFSTAETYTGSADRLKTAQYRMYNKSIWDTLVSDPADDPTQARVYNRLWFEAFKNRQFKKISDFKIHSKAVPQTGTVNGYDGALNIIWADETPVLNMAVLDTNIPANRWSEALNGAAELPKNLPSGSALQVMSGSSSAVYSLVTMENRSTLTADIKKTEQTASVTVEEAIWAAVNQIKRHYKTEKPKQTTKLVLIAATNPTVSDDLLVALQQIGASVDVLLLKSQSSVTKSTTRPEPTAVKASEGQVAKGQQIYLSQLAQQTGGSFSIVNTESELEHAVQSAAVEDEEVVLSTISDAQTTSLAAGESLIMQLPAGRYEKVQMIVVDVPQTDKFTLNITGPKGEVLTPVVDPEGSGWVYAIDTDKTGTGTYIATLMAKETVNGNIYMVGYGFNSADDTPLLMQMNVLQRPVSGNLLEVSIELDRPVLQAMVRATVSVADGKEIMKLNLVDDGTGGDRKPDDGIYTASLNQLEPGEYTFRVVANDNDGKAIASSRGLSFNPRKAAAPDEATGIFQRIDDQTFVVTAFTTPSAGGEGGGGCAVGTGSSSDLLLTLAIIAPLLYLALPRRREEG